jgi:hypothetical protein
VVVVVGAVVVVVVVGEEVLCDDSLPDDEGVVVEVVVDDEVLLVEVVALDVGAALDPPGCSWATTTPMNAAAPVADSTAVRVSRRSRCCARSRSSGVFPTGEPDIRAFSLGMPPSDHRDLAVIAKPTVWLL